MTTEESNQDPNVILLHGLWMSGFAMRYIGRRLKRSGYSVHYFSYKSVFASSDDVLERLQCLIEKCSDGPLYFVAHSLGGLLLLKYFQRHPETAVKAAVLLASPVNGSLAAKCLSKTSLGRFMLGKNRSLLISGVDYSGVGKIGLITGSVGVGLGRLVCKLEKPCDGAVSVSETRAAWLSHHLVLKQNHAGILFSPLATANILRYFSDSHFNQE